MATYSTTVESTWSVEQCFDYMIDLRNTTKWDPSVSSAELIDGEAGQEDSVFRLKVGRSTLDYVITEVEAPNRFKMAAETGLLLSSDVITVESSENKSVVGYDAILELKGALRFADPLLGRVFDRIADKATDGLRRALGEATPPE